MFSSAPLLLKVHAPVPAKQSNAASKYDCAQVPAMEVPAQNAEFVARSGAPVRSGGAERSGMRAAPSPTRERSGEGEKRSCWWEAPSVPEDWPPPVEHAAKRRRDVISSRCI